MERQEYIFLHLLAVAAAEIINQVRRKEPPGHLGDHRYTGLADCRAHDQSSAFSTQRRLPENISGRTPILLQFPGRGFITRKLISNVFNSRARTTYVLCCACVAGCGQRHTPDLNLNFFAVARVGSKSSLSR